MLQMMNSFLNSVFRIRNLKPRYDWNLQFCKSIKRFSSEAHDPHQTLVDASLNNPSTGLVFAKLIGITKYTLKCDIIGFLEGCNLTTRDIKVHYNQFYAPLNMMLQFQSLDTYENAIRMINKKGRLYRLERADVSLWDIITPYDGKFLLIQGLARATTVDDLERFLSGFEYDSSSLKFITRQLFSEGVKMALVRFPSRAQAMSASVTRNGRFCLNNRISIHVLH